jgi:hypothetical protein
MALGLSMGDGNFTPYAKYDARAGRWFTKGADGDIDITDGFTAVFDLETVEVGWMIFASGVARSTSCRTSASACRRSRLAT